MSTIFASDIHLRPDHPERGRRLARFVQRLQPERDRLIVVGDLCDFWFASRQRRGLELACDGLRGLADYVRKGGDLWVLPGNHDNWLGPYYESALGARFISEGRIELQIGETRLLATHGHQFGARSLWKEAMESRSFLQAFHALPDRLATRLEGMLERTNEATQEAKNDEYLALYQRTAAQFEGKYDLIVLGHIHRASDFADMAPRVIVLGGWKQTSSYLVLDGRNITFTVED